MKKKIILGIVFIAMLFCVTACDTNNPGGDNPGNAETNLIKVTNETKALGIFTDMIRNLEFTSEVAGTTTNLLNAVISGEQTITAKLLAGAGKTEASYEVKIGAVIKGIGLVYDPETDTGYIYALTQENKLYLATVTRSGDIQVKRLEIDEVDAIAAVYTDLEGVGKSQASVIIRTKAAEYFTDYQFAGDSTKVIRKITSK